MATLANINSPAVKPAANPSTNALTAGPDQFAAQPASLYSLRFTNTTGAAYTVKLDDPVSATPANADTFDPDVSVIVPITTGVRELYVDTNRFRNPLTGMVSWTYSSGTGVGSTVEIAGPL